MKRRDMIKKLELSGCILIRHGSKQDWYQNLLYKTSAVSTTSGNQRDFGQANSQLFTGVNEDLA